MYIRWLSRERLTPAFGPLGKRDAHWRAILVEAVQVRGKTKQRHISYLVGFTESALAIPQQQRFIWDQIHQRLDRLSKRISREDRRRIEAGLMEKIGKPPTKAQRARLDRARKQWLEKLAKSTAKLRGQAHAPGAARY